MMYKRWSAPPICAVILLITSSCMPVSPPPEISDPLVYVAGDVARADHIAIFVPGAFASIDFFDAAQAWTDPSIARVYYRLPGMDGQPIAPPLDLSDAADHLVDFAANYPDSTISLVGYSTGGAIAVMAADRMARDTQVNVALIAPANEYGGGVTTLWRGTQDVAWAARRAGSLVRRDVWPVYWQTLLFGRAALDDPAYAARIERLSDRYGPDLDTPIVALTDAHTADLRRWTVPDGLDLGHVKTAMFIGMEDNVFTPAQQADLAHRLAITDIRGYPGHAHLLVITHDGVFDDIYAFLTAD